MPEIKDIQSAIVNRVRSLTYKGAVYDSNGVMSDSGETFEPDEVRCDEVGAEFGGGDTRSRRESWVQKRTRWNIELRIAFRPGRRIMFEALEDSFNSSPLVIPKDQFSEQVVVTLSSSRYTHPPQEDPSTGSRATLLMNADIGPR